MSESHKSRRTEARSKLSRNREVAGPRRRSRLGNTWQSRKWREDVAAKSANVAFSRRVVWPERLSIDAMTADHAAGSDSPDHVQLAIESRPHSDAGAGVGCEPRSAWTEPTENGGVWPQPVRSFA